MILFSFIIPVYNVEKYLGECLDSVISQTYGNWEAVLVNDGSADNSAKICDEYAAKDKRIRVYHRDNEGSLLARRYGIEKARGDYFLFIDSDDLLNRQLLEKVRKIIENTSSDMVVYRMRTFGWLVQSQPPAAYKDGTIVGDGGLPKSHIWQKVIAGNSLNSLCTKAVKRSLVDTGTDYKKYAFMNSSTDCMQSMALLDNAEKIYFTDDILYYYRYNNSGISSTKAKAIDSKSLKLHIKTREALYGMKLYYLKKNGYDTDENLRLFYKQNFITKMEQIVGWLSNSKDAGERKAIIKLALDERFLNDGKKYLKPHMFAGKYRRMYDAYIKNDGRLYFELMACSWYRKLVSAAYRIVNGFRNLK